MTQISHKTVATCVGDIALYTLTNAVGASVTLSSLGAGIVAAVVPDRDGTFADIVMGYDDLADYMADGPCAGKTAGRYANRIARGRFSLDGKAYRLNCNLGNHHLHGGAGGFQNRLWNSCVKDGSVVFSRRSPDGEEKYPGNLDVEVTYTFDDDCRLTIGYTAVTDAPTVVNLTNHTYFNLCGHAAPSALDHVLTLDASRMLETDSELVPTGRLTDLCDCPEMDFTEPKTLARDLHTTDSEPLRNGKGYDHCYAIAGYDGHSVVKAATLFEETTGRTLEIFSNQPGIQLYTGNWLDGSPRGKGGAVYHDYSCVAMECQGFPDAPNHPGFPSQRLDPGETYSRLIIYKFSTRK